MINNRINADQFQIQPTTSNTRTTSSSLQDKFKSPQPRQRNSLRQAGLATLQTGRNLHPQKKSDSNEKTQDKCR
jgi:hypothetical protein